MHLVCLKLDVRKPYGGAPSVRVYQGDGEAVLIRAGIMDGGRPYSTAGTTPRFECIKPDGTWVREIAVGKAPNVVEYVLPPQVAAAEGLIDNACFRLLRGAEVDSAGPFAIEVLPSVDGAAGGPSGSYSPELDGLMDELRELIVDGGAKDYAALVGKPRIGGRTLEGDLALADIGIKAVSNKEIEAMFAAGKGLA